ncbi:hypothetical protein FOL46_004988 [Perkinsus olseni]|nr:hypothetical protein FOL46_004988 [Perkinsus olseni]
MKEPSSASEDCSSDGSEYDDVDWASPFDDDMASASTTPAEPRKVEEVERPRARKRRKISRPVSRKEVMVWFNSLENLARLCFESESIKKAAAGRMCDLGVTCDDAPMMAPWPPYWLVSDPSTLDLTLDPLPGPESIADELALSEMGVSTYVGALAATSAVLQEDATIFMAATGYPMPWLEIDKGQAVGFPPSKSRSLGVVVGKKKAGDFFDASAKYGSSRRLKVLSWLRIPPGQDDGKLPKSVEGFKNSGTYILESQLTRFDSLVDTARPVGVFSGRDPIYLRKDVLRLRSESQWERRGLVLTSESCECRRVLSIKGKTVRLYSEDQTVEAPHKSVGVDGEIPVNRFGFVDLTDGRQPPEGSECVEGENLRRLIRKCKEQGIEHWAPAHVGWMAQRPQIGGVVVAISHASALRNAMEEESCSRKAAEHSKEEHLAKLAWKALIKRLLARRYVEMISGSSSSSSS